MIVDEYELIKVNVSIIHENERSLKELWVILERFNRNMTNPTQVRIIQGLLDAVDEEFRVGVSAIKCRKWSLLPFMGTAQKSMFGLLTEADNQEWVVQQGLTYATVIEGVTKNTKYIKQIADIFDDLAKFIKHGRVESKKIMYFN